MSRPIVVVAGVLQDEWGRVLLASRPAGRAMAGYWEFPGGKVEQGETHVQALARELYEELGLRDPMSTPWLTRVHRYDHATVTLHFFRVNGWQGMPTAREGQWLHWHKPGDVAPSPLLPANQPLLKWLVLPPVYALTRALELGHDLALAQLMRGFERGLRLVQVREKGMETVAARRFVSAVVDEAQRWGAWVMVNGETAGLDVEGVQGIHLTARQLQAATERPAFPWVAASCHGHQDLAHAAALGLDFVVLGPVQRTLTHPDQPPLGWSGWAHYAQDTPLPLYAIGGLSCADGARARALGAQGVAVLRQLDSLESSGCGQR